MSTNTTGEICARIRVSTSRTLQQLAILLTAFAGLATPAHANLVVNGGFESTLINASSEFGSRYPSQQVIGWTTSGYNMLFQSGTATTTGAIDEYECCLTLWGPANGSANGLPDSSPDGGNFIGADSSYLTGAISQVIYGLTPGTATTVSFYWGAAQQYGSDGDFTDMWQVSLGNEVHSTAGYDNPNRGFSGWMHESITFTPDNTSEILSFLAVGTPGGQPPFSLLDGVTVTPTPEPSVWGMAIAGLGALIVCERIRRKSSARLAPAGR
jgi:hypothetical protein